MTEKVECEFFLAVDEEGNFELDSDGMDASNRLSENWGGLAVRVIKIKAKVRPAIIEEVDLDISDEAGETTQVAAE